MVIHKCKVKSKPACHISKAERAKIEEQVLSGNFQDTIPQAYAKIQKNRQVECYQYQDSFVLPMKRNLFQLLTISVQVNGHPCTFIIDTGAQISGIKAQKAKELKLYVTDANLSIGSIGGTQKDMSGVIADSFQLGAIRYRQLPMIALDESDFSLRFGSIDLFSFDGILGWDILRTLDFEMDDIAKQFKVINNRYRIEYPNMINGSFPLFLIKTPEDQLGIYGFDSGSKISWMGEHTIHSFRYTMKEEGRVMGFGVHGLESLEMKILSEIDLYLDKAHIHLQDTGTGRVSLFQNFTFDGVLGNEIFKGRRIRFLNSQAMVLLA